MTTLTHYRARAYAGDADLQAVCDLLNLCDSVDDLDDNYSVEDLKLEFDDPRLDKARDLRLWEDADGRLAGFGQTWIPEDGEVVDGFLYWRVHPEARGAGLESDIIAWGSERLRQVGRERGQPVKIRSWAREHYTYAREALDRHGFGIVRYFFRMARPLDEPIPDPRTPEGFTLRHVQTDQDVERWVEAFNLSFIDHYNFHPVTVEAHRHWLTSPKYVAERDLVAVAPDGTFAAFCFCWIDAESNERNTRSEGWIDMLGTRRGYRKIGLGRAMLLAGLHRLKADGVDTAILGVDADNPTGALRLYESVGFKVVHTSVTYLKDL